MYIYILKVITFILGFLSYYISIITFTINVISTDSSMLVRSVSFWFPYIQGLLTHSTSSLLIQFYSCLLLGDLNVSTGNKYCCRQSHNAPLWTNCTLFLSYLFTSLNHIFWQTSSKGTLFLSFCFYFNVVHLLFSVPLKR